MLRRKFHPRNDPLEDMPRSSQLAFPTVTVLGDAALMDVAVSGAMLAGASAYMPGTESSKALRSKGAHFGVSSLMCLHKGVQGQRAETCFAFIAL